MKLERTHVPAFADPRGTRFQMLDLMTDCYVDVIVSSEAVRKLIAAQLTEAQILEKVILLAESKENDASNVPQTGLKLEASDFDV